MEMDKSQQEYRYKGGDGTEEINSARKRMEEGRLYFPGD